MIRGSTDCCYKCGGPHFVKDCTDNTNFDDHDKESKINEVTPSKKYADMRLTEHDGWAMIDKCQKCYRVGHTQNQCFARSSVYPTVYYNNQHQAYASQRQAIYNFFARLLTRK
jgi:hypothetical protein